MKRIILLACTLCFAFTGTSAQDLGENSNKKELKEELKESNGSQVLEEKRNSGFEASYMALDGGFGIHYGFIFDGIALGGKFISGDENDYLRSNTGWGINLGYNWRHWLGKSFYIEARAGIQYLHQSYEYVAGTKTTTKVILGKTHTFTSKVWKKESDGKLGLFLTPRIGLALGESFAITAGYEWDFAEFKFDKGHTNDYFTIGLSVIV